MVSLLLISEFNSMLFSCFLWSCLQKEIHNNKQLFQLGRGCQFLSYHSIVRDGKSSRFFR